jgi:hypothetical protein
MVSSVPGWGASHPSRCRLAPGAGEGRIQRRVRHRDGHPVAPDVPPVRQRREAGEHREGKVSATGGSRSAPGHDLLAAERHLGSGVLLIGADRVAFHGPGADQAVQAPQRRVRLRELLVVGYDSPPFCPVPARLQFGSARKAWPGSTPPPAGYGIRVKVMSSTAASWRRRRCAPTWLSCRSDRDAPSASIAPLRSRRRRRAGPPGRRRHHR